jgi:protein-S-isoprenylcysteine O-methyltransferase Ste14
VEKIIVAILYTTILVSFVWARFTFFRSDNQSSKLITSLYDPIVFVFVSVSYWSLLTIKDIPTVRLITGCISLLAAAALFSWSLKTAKGARIAFNYGADQIYKSGAYGFVRHPLYLSYSITWIAVAAICDYTMLYLPLVYLLVFYLIAARKEEKKIMEGSHSEEYKNYKQNVGMFFPRVTQWVNLNLG